MVPREMGKSLPMSSGRTGLPPSGRSLLTKHRRFAENSLQEVEVGIGKGDVCFPETCKCTQFCGLYGHFFPIHQNMKPE